MPKAVGSRLACFYCGKRSGLKYDGRLGEFLCLYCDATNYLDQNGDITDPPVATTSNLAQPMQYAIPRASSPVPHAAASTNPDASKPSASIFCTTCLANQARYTACLAQYDSEDEDSDNESVRAPVSGHAGGRNRKKNTGADPQKKQRRFFTYRRTLERLYPQVCARCEPLVLKRVEQARYTAKTDHLRRMMERSRTGRLPGRKKTGVDRVDVVGWLAWWGGLCLQMAWHAVSVVDVMEAARDASVAVGEGRQGAAGAAWWGRVVAVLAIFRALLPAGDRLNAWGVYAAVLGAWWNPQFVQVWRGFSKHLLGLTQWYTFQGMVVALRLCSRNMLDLRPSSRLAENAIVAGHVSIAVFSCLIYTLARSTVRVDATPLFGEPKHEAGPGADAPAAAQLRSASRAAQKAQSLSDVLDEVLSNSGARSPPLPPAPRPQARPPSQNSPQLLRPVSRSTLMYRNAESPRTRFDALSLGGGARPSPFRQQPQPQQQQQQQQQLQEQQQQHHHHRQYHHQQPGPYNHLHRRQVPPTPPTRPTRNTDEMDWSPVRPLPRALANMPKPAPFRASSLPPTQPGDNPFWFKVPPAPITPAHRLRNPPATRPAEKPVAEKFDPSSFFRNPAPRWSEPRDVGEAAENCTVTFADPTFFAPDRTNELDNDLLGMLNTSLTLNIDDDDDEDDEDDDDDDGQLGGRSREPAGNMATLVGTSTSRHASMAQAALFGILLGLWKILNLAFPPRYQPIVAASTLAAAGLVSLWDLTTVVLGIRSGGGSGSRPKATTGMAVAAWAPYAVSGLCIAEIGWAAHVGKQAWGGNEDAVVGGAQLLGEMAAVRAVQAWWA